MKSKLRSAVSFALSLAIVCSLVPAMAADGDSARGYNPGPDPKTAIGKEFIDLYASIPDMGAISKQVTGSQKFRVPDGVILGRTLYGLNQVKAIAVGQDGTHGAKFSEESAAGASFGGVAQHYLGWFGVGKSAAFTNDFLTTIYGQYGAFSTPYIKIDPVTKKKSIQFGKIVENGTWLFANHRQSPIARFRNNEFDLRLRQNPDSLELFVLFGGAAADGFGAFIESEGGHVGSQYTEEDLKWIRTIVYDTVSAGGNNEFPVPLDKNGNDIYEILVGRKLNYKDLHDQQIAMDALVKAGDRAIDMMITTHGGIHGSGLVHPAQIGGFKMDKVEINGVVTDSLKGLPLSDGTSVKRDIYFADLPHPTALGMMKDKAQRDRLIAKKTEGLRRHQEKDGWRIPPDPGLENLFAQGKPLDYGKSDLPPEHFEFGIAAFRRGSSTDAARLGPNVVVSGKVTSDNSPFNKADLDAALKAPPSSFPPTTENYLTRASGPERYTFDMGPSARFEKITAETFTPAFLKTIIAVKAGSSPAKDGINAYYTASSPDLGAYAPYRGNLETADVLIVGDRVWGFDEVSNSRSLTGARGQVLNGLMQDMRVGDNYVVLDTVPFNMTGKGPGDWAFVLPPTMNYRERMISEILRNGTVKVVLTDGANAAAETKRILQKLGASLPVIDIKGVAGDPFSGVKEAGAEMAARLPQFRGKVANGKMVDIPRSHLPFWTDRYEGTGGDRIINSTDPLQMGRTLARVTPFWASSQVRIQSRVDADSVQALISILKTNNYRRLDEKVPDYLARMKAADPSFDPRLTVDPVEQKKESSSAGGACRANVAKITGK